MKKTNSSSSLKRAGARILSDVSAVPSRLHKHVIKPIQTSTGHGIRSAQRAVQPTVGSVASFMAAVLGLDNTRGQSAV